MSWNANSWLTLFFSSQDDKLILEAPSSQPRARSKRQRRDTTNDLLELVVNSQIMFFKLSGADALHHKLIVMFESTVFYMDHRSKVSKDTKYVTE